MNKEALDWIIIVGKLTTWGLSLLAIYWILLKLTNHSPTIEEVILTLVGTLIVIQVAIISILINFIGEMKEFKGKMDQHKQQSDRCFYALALEFKNTDSHFRKHMIKYHKEKYGY